MSNKLDKILAEKEAYEEANFLRPNLTRKDKQLRKKIATQGAMLRFQDEFKVCVSCLTCRNSAMIIMRLRGWNVQSSINTKQIWARD